MPDLAHDLLLLITNLAQHREKDNILSLFHEGIQSLFSDCSFAWQEVEPSPGKLVFEVQTRNKVFGYFTETSRDSLPAEQHSMIQNAVQMLAVILERLEHEDGLNTYRGNLENLVESKTHDLVIRDVKYRNLYETMVQGVVYQDSEGFITSANSAAERILGLTLDQMQGRTSADPRWRSVREDGSDFPGDEHPSMEALRTGQEVKDVLMGVFNPKKKDITWINIHAVPQFRPGEEKPYEVFTTFEDITSVTLSFEQLKASESLYHDLVETSHDLIWQCDHEGRYTYLNPAWKEIFGYEVEEMLGKRFTDFQTNAYARRDLKEFKRLMRGDVVKGLETVHLAKDGREIHLVFNAKFVRDEKGNNVGTCGSAYDITDRVINLAKVTALSSRQEAILSAIPDIIMEVDENKVYTWTNQTGIDFFGEDVIGKSADYYFEGEQDTYQRVQPIFSGHEDVIYVESWQRRKDGEHRLLAWWCRVLKDVEGRVSGALSTARDITGIKVAEEKVRMLNLELEDRVRERTKELETANRELESFAYSVSHDLRAPLRAIDGFSTIIAERYANLLDSEGQRFIQSICRNTLKMDALITSLLDLSRIARKEMNMASIDMNEMVQAVIGELIPKNERKQIRLETLPMPGCLGDPTLIRQVITNLLSNALKYTGKQKKRSIQLGARDDTHGSTIYWIKDNGIGFKNTYAEKIFGVFQRLHTEDEFEGTGVGLAIVDRIIKRHGGSVWAEGKEGKGATFFFTLPRVPSITNDQ